MDTGLVSFVCLVMSDRFALFLLYNMHCMLKFLRAKFVLLRKPPGYDGLLAEFYLKFWNLLGVDLVEV